MPLKSPLDDARIGVRAAPDDDTQPTPALRWPRAWRRRTRLDARVERRLLPNGSSASTTSVSVDVAAIGQPPGVYVHNVGETRFEAERVESAAGVQLLEFVQSADARRAHGRVRVRNVAYDKRVYLRFTLDAWRTQLDVSATFVGSEDREWDVFGFEINLPTPHRSRRTGQRRHRVELAIGYTAAGSEWWDNRDGKNYLFVLAPFADSVQRVDRPPSLKLVKTQTLALTLPAADRDREADEAAARRGRPSSARFFAGGRGGSTTDRQTVTATSNLPGHLRYNADVFANVWLERRRRLERSSFGNESVVARSSVSETRRTVDCERARRRLRPHSPWRPRQLLLAGPPLAPQPSTSSQRATIDQTADTPAALASTLLAQPSDEPAEKRRHRRNGKGVHRPARPETLIALAGPRPFLEHRQRRLRRRIQVLVRDLSGHVQTILVRGRTNVAVLQARLASKVGIPASQQRLTFAGRDLHPRDRLADHGIRHGSTVSLALRLLGGGLPSTFRAWLEPTFKKCFTEANHAPFSAAHCPPGSPPVSSAELHAARAAAYHKAVHTVLTADVLALRKRGITVDIYVIQDASNKVIWAKRLEHDARSRSKAAVRTRKDAQRLLDQLADIKTSGRFAATIAALEAGQRPQRPGKAWRGLVRRCRAVFAAGTRMPASYPAGSRDQRSVSDLVTAIAADPAASKPSGRIVYGRADAEADQGIALVARAHVAHRVVVPSAIGVESADGDYVLHDSPTQSYGHQIFWSFRRRSTVVLDRAKLYRDKAFPAKTERGARLFAALIGDDTSREGRLGWSVRIIVDLVEKDILDLDGDVDEVLDYALVDSVKGDANLNYVRKLIEIRLDVMDTCLDAKADVWLQAETIYLAARAEMRPPAPNKRLAGQFTTEGIVWARQPMPTVDIAVQTVVPAMSVATQSLRSRSTWRHRQRTAAHAQAPRMPAAPRQPPPAETPSTRYKPTPLFDPESAQVDKVQIGSLSRAALVKQRREAAEAERAAVAAEAKLVDRTLRDTDEELEAATNDATSSDALGKIAAEGDLEADGGSAGGTTNPATDFAFLTAIRTLASTTRTYDPSALTASTRPVIISIRHLALYCNVVRPTLRFAARCYIRHAFAQPSGEVPVGLKSPAEFHKRLVALGHLLIRSTETVRLGEDTVRRRQLALIEGLGLTAAEVARMDESLVRSCFTTVLGSVLHLNLDATGVRAAIDTIRSSWPLLEPFVGNACFVTPMLKTLATNVIVSAVQGAPAALARVVTAKVEAIVATIAAPKQRAAVAGPASKAIQRFILQQPLALAHALAPSTARDAAREKLCRFLLALLRSRGALAAADAAAMMQRLEVVAVQEVASLARSLGPGSKSPTARTLLKNEPTTLLRWLHALALDTPSRGETEPDRGICPRIDPGHKEPFWFDSTGLLYIVKSGFSIVSSIRDFLARDVRLQPLLSLGHAFLGSFDATDDRADLRKRFERAFEVANAVLIPTAMYAPVDGKPLKLTTNTLVAAAGVNRGLWEHVFNYDSAPHHAFPSGSARSDGFNIWFGLRDGGHARAGRVQEVSTADGHFDVRRTVQRHLARTAPTDPIQPYKILHRPAYSPVDPSQPMSADVNGAPNAVLVPVRPSFLYLIGMDILAPDMHAHDPPRSLAPRPLGQPAPSPWASPTAPSDRLSLAVRADRITGRRLRLSKFLGPEKTVGGMPWSIKARSTKNHGLNQIAAELETMGVQHAEQAIRQAEVNICGASLFALSALIVAGIDTGEASRIAAALWHVTDERHDGTDERVRVEEGVIIKDGARAEHRRRFDRAATLRRTELTVVARPVVDRAIRQCIAAGLVAAPDRDRWMSFISRLAYGLDRSLLQLDFDRRRTSQSLDSHDVDGLLQLMGLLGTRSPPTFIGQVTASQSMPTIVGGVARSASATPAPWLVVLGNQTSGSSSRAMITVRQLQRTCIQRRLPVVITTGTEHCTSKRCPHADTCPSRTDPNQRGNTIANPRREADGSAIWRLSQCTTCGLAGDRDVFAASNIAYAKMSELLHGISEFSKPISATPSA